MAFFLPGFPLDDRRRRENIEKLRGVREQAVYHVRRAEKTPRKFSLKLKSSNPAMKTLNHRSSVASRSFGLAFSLLLVGGLVSSAYAGPGLSYWQGKVPAKVEQPALASKPDAVLQRVERRLRRRWRAGSSGLDQGPQLNPAAG